MVFYADVLKHDSRLALGRPLYSQSHSPPVYLNTDN
jgi:hypothetical protein